MIGKDELCTWILITLNTLGGTHDRRVVLGEMKGILGNRLHDDDFGRRANGRDVVWENNADFARLELSRRSLLQSSGASGRGTWALTPAGWRESEKLLAQMTHSLCPTFRSISTDVAWRTQMGRSVGLVPGETTFTDNALLHLAISQPATISIQRFPSRREAETGADWEWWIRDWNGYVGFRVQAKRADPRTGRVRLDQAAAPTVHNGDQVDVFVQRCAADRIAGLYCVYSDRQPTWQPGLAAADPCPHGPADPAQWACTVLLATAALRLASMMMYSAEMVLAAGVPWYQLVCHGPFTGSTAGVLEVFEGLRNREMSAQSRTDGQSLGPGPATDPPEQVRAHFAGDLETIEPWSDLAGVVLADLTRGNVDTSISRWTRRG